MENLTQLINDIQPPNRQSTGSDFQSKTENDFSVIQLSEDEQNDIDNFQEWFKTLNPVMQTSIRAIVNTDPDSSRDPIPAAPSSSENKYKGTDTPQRHGSFISDIARPQAHNTVAISDEIQLDDYPVTEVLSTAPKPDLQPLQSSQPHIVPSESNTPASESYATYGAWYQSLSETERTAFNTYVRGTTVHN